MDPECLGDPPVGIFDPIETDKTLDIAIIGAGVAGLAAAVGLLRSGHRIFERSRFSNEVGAAIHICPNASRVLRCWGFDFEKANQMSFRQGRVIRGGDFDVICESKYDHWPERYGAEAYFLHRVDLHNGLKPLALNARDALQPAKHNLSLEVVDVDCETEAITLATGNTYQFDLVVVADGVHAGLSLSICPKVIGHDIPAKATGHSAFRFLIPTQKLLQSEILRPMFENVPSDLTIHALGDRRLVWYPCRFGQLQNFVGIHPESEAGTCREERNIATPLEELLETYKDFNASIIEIYRKAEDLKLWKLLFRAPISSWKKGKVVLIADAAHPMLPHQGQGGGQAIEDGSALGALFSHIKSIDEMPQRLAYFEDARKDRASAMQIFSNVGQDEAEKNEKAAKLYVKGPTPKVPEDFHNYNFGYSVFRECIRILETEKTKHAPNWINRLGRFTK